MLKVKLIRSTIGCTPKQRAIVQALGLRKVNMVKEFSADNAAIRGMIAKIEHMVEVVS